jgi:hypothetical protein
VINDDGGTAVAGDFTLDSGGTNDSPDNFAGQEAPGTTVTLDAGSYDVSETGPSGYTESDSAACSGTIGLGETKTCTVTNNDIRQDVAQITPTATTCSSFRDGTSATLTEIQYSVKNGTINQVNPGVFFYWVKVTAVAGNNSFTVTQTNSQPPFPDFTVASGSSAFDSTCTAIRSRITQASNGDVTVSFSAAAAGTVYIGIKYNASSVKGSPTPNPTTVHYDFATVGVPSSTEGLDLVKKP